MCGERPSASDNHDEFFNAEEVIELDVPEHLRPITMRALGMTPNLDAAVDGLPAFAGPFHRRLAVRTLRYYRSRIAPRFGSRCVFEPSCSRYGELAIRRFGIFRAVWLTSRRLWRCRPGRGGVDLELLGDPDDLFR